MHNPKLTARQRALLLDIGDAPLDVFGAGSTVASLVKRGFLVRRSIGMRWWRVRRTDAGREAVGLGAKPRAIGVSAGPMGGPGAGPVR